MVTASVSSKRGVTAPSRELGTHHLPHSSTAELCARLCLGPCSVVQALKRSLHISVEIQCQWSWNMISEKEKKSDFDKFFFLTMQFQRSTRIQDLFKIDKQVSKTDYAQCYTAYMW